MIERLDSLLFLHTRRKRIGAALAIAGAAITTGVGIAAPAHADSAPPTVVADGASFGEVSSGFGALLGAGGCIAAPSPVSCGFAVKSNADYLQKYGDQPLYGNPDMTQDGPLPAL